MNIVIGFSLLFGVIAMVYYFIELKVPKRGNSANLRGVESTNPQNINKYTTNRKIVEDDIILSDLANEGVAAIMWNSNPAIINSELDVYNYNIMEQKTGKQVAFGDSTGIFGVHKIKNIPISKGNTYIVTVVPGGNIPNSETETTTVTIPFFPIAILDVKVRENELDITTDLLPTNLQVYSGNDLLPNSRSNIKIQPPGITTLIEPDKSSLTLLLYNGKNTGTLYYFRPETKVL